MRTTTGKLTATATVLAAALGGGLTQASAAATGSPEEPRPSSCRPANHTARITQDASSAGHSHYRVTLTAAPGYERCTLAGSPVEVQFSHNGVPISLPTGSYGDQDVPVRFGPGHPAHFDIQVPDQLPTIPADEATFTLSTPTGQIPGDSAASGKLRITEGTVIGPVVAGA
ncbi:DUF4232 domain-containing protein [Streptomyces sp. NPDC059897]|uniref:DUF4232 domain-containing protein n=1 Tax=Streptomyces sp. NPDC059897 TaxID=3346994 RepID=UPI003662C5E0